MSADLLINKSPQQNASITLLVVPNVTLATSSKIFTEGADEVIEVGVDGVPLLNQKSLDQAGYRYIKAGESGLAHAFNLGISFGTSEWIILSFGDECVTHGWIDSLRNVLLEQESGCIHMFLSEFGSKIPLVVVKRSSFVYGPLDESFPCPRLSLLHWIFRLFPRPKHRILKNETISQHNCDFIESGTTPLTEAPLAALLDLWHEMDPQLRCTLLDQALAKPDDNLQSLAVLNDSLRKVQHKENPYRAAYNPKQFWENNSPNYIRWEIYQPDEPEILTLMNKVSPYSILELGCGAGRNTRYFSTSKQYVGIDISMNLLSRAVERQEENSLGILCGDITELPFVDASFDLVFADSTVQHIVPEKIEKCISDIVRISAEYICVIEYTEEESNNGDWFQQTHMFAHDYRQLFKVSCDLVWHTEIALHVHPAHKEVFLFKKKHKRQK